MPKMLSHYTDMARRDVDPDTVAAVPVRHPIVASPRRSTLAAAAALLAGPLATVVGVGAARAANATSRALARPAVPSAR